MQLSQYRITLPNFHFLDVKTQNIWMTVNLNAYLCLQRPYRHLLMIWNSLSDHGNGLHPESTVTKCTDSALKLPETRRVRPQTSSSCPTQLGLVDVLRRRWGTRPRCCFCLKPPLLLSLNSEHSHLGGRLRFWTFDRKS